MYEYFAFALFSVDSFRIVLFGCHVKIGYDESISVTDLFYCYFTNTVVLTFELS